MQINFKLIQTKEPIGDNNYQLENVAYYEGSL